MSQSSPFDKTSFMTFTLIIMHMAIVGCVCRRADPSAARRRSTHRRPQPPPQGAHPERARQDRACLPPLVKNIMSPLIGARSAGKVMMSRSSRKVEAGPFVWFVSGLIAVSCGCAGICARSLPPSLSLARSL